MSRIRRAFFWRLDLCGARNIGRLRPSARAIFLLALASNFGHGQAVEAKTSASEADAQHIAGIEHRLDELTGTLMQTQKALQQSLVEIQRLQAEVDSLRHGPIEPSAAVSAVAGPATMIASQPVNSSEAEIQALREQQEIVEAEIKQHEQIKIETASKYNLRVTGLALFNAFSNAGVVDNVELPALALSRNPGSSHGSAGATLRQTIFGVSATDRSSEECTVRPS